MSFKSILKTIGGLFVAVEPTVESLAKTIFPATRPFFAFVDPMFAKIQSDIVTVEAAKPIGTPGNIASDTVIASFEAGIDVAEMIAAAEGKVVVYDRLALQTAINAQVSALNSFAVVKASLKTVPIGQVPAGMTPAVAGVATAATS